MEPLVELPDGKIKGTTRINLNDEKFYSFTCIPYGKAPLGNLRFKAPQPVEPWEGIKDATKEENYCFQMNLMTLQHIGCEDCLSLHVFTKKLPKEKEKLKPVMVYIHGGGFLMGSPDTTLNGPEYLMTEDVVLVSICYRLGLFGFMHFDDASLDVPGNAGLKDQVFALKWVQRNIKHFNGDPNNVTLFGSSAGSASIEFLVVSPAAKNLFHKAIMQSGSALNPWAMGDFNTRDLAKSMRIPDITEKEFLKLLEDMPISLLYGAQTNYLKFLKVTRLEFNIEDYLLSIHGECDRVITRICALFDTRYPDRLRPIRDTVKSLLNNLVQCGSFHPKVNPVVDNNVILSKKIPVDLGLITPVVEKPNPTEFLTKKPIDIIQSGQYNSVPIIIGYNDNEGGMFQFAAEFSKRMNRESAKVTINHCFPYETDLEDADQTRQLTDILTNFYCKNEENEDIPQLLLTDAYFVAGIITTAKNQATFSKNPVYLYRFTLTGNLNIMKRIALNYPSSGASHGDEMGYLFKFSIMPVEIGEIEEAAIRRMVRLWTNFAKYGNPTAKDSELGIKWKPIEDDHLYFLDIGENLRIDVNPEEDRMKIWKKIFAVNPRTAHY